MSSSPNEFASEDESYLEAISSDYTPLPDVPEPTSVKKNSHEWLYRIDRASALYFALSSPLVWLSTADFIPPIVNGFKRVIPENSTVAYIVGLFSYLPLVLDTNKTYQAYAEKIHEKRKLEDEKPALEESKETDAKVAIPSLTESAQSSARKTLRVDTAFQKINLKDPLSPQESKSASAPDTPLTPTEPAQTEYAPRKIANFIKKNLSALIKGGISSATFGAAFASLVSSYFELNSEQENLMASSIAVVLLPFNIASQATNFGFGKTSAGQTDSTIETDQKTFLQKSWGAFCEIFMLASNRIYPITSPLTYNQVFQKFVPQLVAEIINLVKADLVEKDDKSLVMTVTAINVLVYIALAFETLKLYLFMEEKKRPQPITLPGLQTGSDRNTFAAQQALSGLRQCWKTFTENPCAEFIAGTLRKTSKHLAANSKGIISNLAFAGAVCSIVAAISPGIDGEILSKMYAILSVLLLPLNTRAQYLSFGLPKESGKTPNLISPLGVPPSPMAAPPKENKRNRKKVFSSEDPLSKHSFASFKGKDRTSTLKDRKYNKKPLPVSTDPLTPGSRSQSDSRSSLFGYDDYYDAEGSDSPRSRSRAASFVGPDSPQDSKLNVASLFAQKSGPGVGKALDRLKALKNNSNNSTGFYVPAVKGEESESESESNNESDDDGLAPVRTKSFDSR